MKLSVLANLYAKYPLLETLEKLAALGVEAAEIGAGGFPGKDHCDPAVLLNDQKALEDFKDAFKKTGVELCALSCHGNPVHPNKDVAKTFHDDFVNTVLLAEKLGIDTVITFSGCPGGAPGDTTPNWATCPWPDDFLGILDYQWNDVLIPYWEKTAKFAEDHGVSRIAFEMHPGFCVYNAETAVKLMEAVNSPGLGVTCDPSNIVWQGCDVPNAIRKIGPWIKHFHAKDSIEQMENITVNGRLDAKNYADRVNRAWTFRTVGYGHDELYWKRIISALVDIGYNGAISIEHEDTYMNNVEGLSKAIEFLNRCIIREEAGEMTWANTDNLAKA